jgi:hypothetical protein
MIKSFFSFYFWSLSRCLLRTGAISATKSQTKNAQVESIYRNRSDQSYVIDTPAHRVREAYPWETDS